MSQGPCSTQPESSSFPIPEVELLIIQQTGYLLTNGYGFSLDVLERSFGHSEERVASTFGRGFHPDGRINLQWFQLFVRIVSEAGWYYLVIPPEPDDVVNWRYEWCGTLLKTADHTSKTRLALTGNEYTLRVSRDYPYVQLRDPELDTTPETSR